MNTPKRTARWLAALATCAMVVAAPVPAASATTPDPATTEVAAKAKLTAKLLDSKVKAHGKARVRGKLELPADARGLELVVVQKLVAGVWVDVLTSSCRPNATFRLSLSFSVTGWYSLRVYHPATTVASATLSLNVVG